MKVPCLAPMPVQFRQNSESIIPGAVASVYFKGPQGFPRYSQVGKSLLSKEPLGIERFQC